MAWSPVLQALCSAQPIHYSPWTDHICDPSYLFDMLLLRSNPGLQWTLDAWLHDYLYQPPSLLAYSRSRRPRRGSPQVPTPLQDPSAWSQSFSQDFPHMGVEVHLLGKNHYIDIA